MLIKTCNRRGALPLAAMARLAPGGGTPVVKEPTALKVRADKERETTNGHDGTWVAHPDLVPVAMEVFDRVMPGPNQLGKLREDVRISREALLKVHSGARTE